MKTIRVLERVTFRILADEARGNAVGVHVTGICTNGCEVSSVVVHRTGCGQSAAATREKKKCR